jgi:hypothetical protein
MIIGGLLLLLGLCLFLFFIRKRRNTYTITVETLDRVEGMGIDLEVKLNKFATVAKLKAEIAARSAGFGESIPCEEQRLFYAPPSTEDDGDELDLIALDDAQTLVGCGMTRLSNVKMSVPPACTCPGSGSLSHHLSH